MYIIRRKKVPTLILRGNMSRLYVDMEARISLILDSQVESLNIGAVDVTCLACE
jgi:hypothetical protein